MNLKKKKKKPTKLLKQKKWNNRKHTQNLAWF